MHGSGLATIRKKLKSIVRDRETLSVNSNSKLSSMYCFLIKSSKFCLLFYELSPDSIDSLNDVLDMLSLIA